jgi:2-oxoisovalerate dehydrogenase E1 component
MTVNTRTTEERITAEPLDMLALYRTMMTARVMNDVLKTRKTQGRFPFYIGCAGHESMAAVVAALQPEDWLSLYYRDLGAWLQRTGDIHTPLREAYSRSTGSMGAGRNMPAHYSSKEQHILPAFSEVAGLAPFAGGAAFALQWHKTSQIILYTGGDGAVATNDFYALFRQASVHRLPVLMVIENNGWAITTTSDHQWSGSLVEWARGGGVYAEEVDGTNPLAAYEATLHMAKYVRSGKGPALIDLHMGLLDPHSSSTDIKGYRTKEEIEATTATKDPVKNFGRWLVEHGHLQENEIEHIRKEIKGEIERAEAEILKEPEIDPARVMEHVIEIPAWQENTPRGTKRQLPMLSAINEALLELARRDDGFFVYGQDVGSLRGGVFGATAALRNELPERAISSPLNEQVIVGIAAGAGMVDDKARCA